MQENVELNELETSLITLKTLTEKMTKNLNNMNILIRENINSGVGVWDSNMAEMYRTKWENLAQNFPDVVNTLQKQEANLEEFINNMKKVEEA